MTNSCPRRVQIVDLLLEPGLDDESREHVANCRECSAELADLQGLPAILASVDEDALGGAGLRRLLCRVRARRRRRVAGSLAVLVVVAVFVTAVLSGLGTGASGTGGAPSRAVSAAGAGSVRLVSQLTARPWGTALTVHASGLPPKTLCELVAVGTGGAGEVVGWWWSAGGKVGAVRAATSWHLGQLSRVELRIGGRTVAATRVARG